MKKKIISILLIGFACISLAACEGDDVESVLDQATEELAGDEQSEPEEPQETPEVVKNLSPEEDALLSGTLKDNVYTNEFFGYQFTVPEGWDLEDGNEDKLVPLTEAYEKGYNGVLLSAMTQNEQLDLITICISALEEDEIGLSEQELVEKEVQDTKEFYELAEVDSSPELKSADLCGEEHPAVISTDNTGNSSSVMTTFIIPKDDFKLEITIFNDSMSYEELSAFFEKL